MVHVHGVGAIRNHAGLLAQFAQGGGHHLLAGVHQTGRQAVREQVGSGPVLTLHQVPVVRRVVHEHDHARRVAHHLASDYDVAAVPGMQGQTHVLHREHRTLVHRVAFQHGDRPAHVDDVAVLLHVTPRTVHLIDNVHGSVFIRFQYTCGRSPVVRSTACGTSSSA